MTDPTQASSEPPQAGGIWNRQYVVAALLLLAFFVLVGFMLVLADTTNDTVWQRRIYLFSAVEAIVFTAVGWLFGREVNRAAAETARQDATAARQNESAARDEARYSAEQTAQAKQDAERIRGETVAAVMENSRPATASDAGPRPGRAHEPGAGAGAEPAPSGAVVVDLHGLMRDLYRRGPDAPER